MKQIINNKLYDTEKAEKVYEYLRKVEDDKNIFGLKTYIWRKITVYKTSKENYFLHYGQADKIRNGSIYTGNIKECIEEITKEEIKEIIKELDTELYIKLFGEVEEA